MFTVMVEIMIMGDFTNAFGKHSFVISGQIGLIGYHFLLMQFD